MSRSELAPLVTVLEARVARFEKQLQKATGTVNRQAGRQEQRWRKQHKNLDSRFKAMGKSMRTGLLIGTAAVTAASAAVTTFAKNALQRTADLERFSNRAGVTAERFQELQFAAKNFGVDSEKLSSILLDVNDKLGDAASTGGGAFQDFLENVGLQVGITIDSFRGLTADQSLGLVVKTLEDAGANAQDFSFYLESLASDSSDLLPLLKNNGAELGKMSTKFRELGGVLSNEAVAKGAEANRKLTELGVTIKGSLTSAIVDLAPEIEGITEDIIDLMPTLVEWARIAIRELMSLGDTYRDIFNLKPSDSRDAKENGQRANEASGLADVIEATGGEDSGLNQAGFVKESIYDILGKEQVEAIKARGESVVEALRAESKRLRMVGERLAEEELAEDLNRLEERAKTVQKMSSKNGKGISGPTAIDRTAIDAEIEAIREVGRLESEQIQELLAERLASIDKAKIAESEKAQLRANVHADAQKELKEIADAEADFKAQAMADIEAQANADFAANQDRLSYVAEIEATQARIAGRGIEATRIELEAVRERYEAELAYIEQVIEKKGTTPELEADRANVLAGLEENRAARIEFERITLEQIDAMTNNDSRLENALEFIDRAEQAKIDRLADYYGQTEALNAEHQERMNEIEEQADEERLAARLQSYEDNLNSLQSALGGASQALRDAGLADSKAGKAIAKAEQVTAIGKAIVNTGQGVTEALALGPVGIPLAAAIGALGAVQVGVMAAQTFDGGGFTGSGTRTGGVDGKGGYYAIMHPNEVVADMTRPGREVDGQSLQSAFGFDVPQSNYKASQFASLSQSSISIGGAVVTINGNADDAAIQRLESMLAKDRKERKKEFNMMANQRDKRLTSRTERRVGR